MSKAEEMAWLAFPEDVVEEIEFRVDFNLLPRHCFQAGYEQAEKDILSLIESRISEIIGDAQPRPALRAELEELIKRIKED